MATQAVAPPLQEAQLMELIEGWKAMQLTDYVQTADLTLIIADYVQTLPDEIQLMWPSKGFSLPRFLFFSLRYGIFVERLLEVYYIRLQWATPTLCHRTFSAVCMASGIILLASEVVLFVRVYAFSGRNKRLLIYLTFQFVALAVSIFVLLAYFTKNVLYMELPIVPYCMPIDLPPMFLGGVYTVAFFSMLAVMLIMVYLARSQHKGLNSTLFAVFYRDGLYYFACLSVFAIFNGIMGFVAPVRYKFLFIQMETDLHAILSTRMLLHLRRQSARGPAAYGDGSTPDVYYLSGINTVPAPQFARNEEATTNSVLVTVSTTTAV